MNYVLLKHFGIPSPEIEYKFHPSRKWRIDYAWPGVKLAVEIEGGAWVKGRHNRASGFIKDMEKYNQLILLGWRLLRFQPGKINYRLIKDVYDKGAA
uniref:DUF559 domain-containing protein n=1 Tax=viral metagenome TaxID=1070528 RepID=A0A6M3LIE1_9ZZZZ